MNRSCRSAPPPRRSAISNSAFIASINRVTVARPIATSNRPTGACLLISPEPGVSVELRMPAQVLKAHDQHADQIDQCRRQADGGAKQEFVECHALPSSVASSLARREPSRYAISAISSMPSPMATREVAIWALGLKGANGRAHDDPCCDLFRCLQQRLLPMMPDIHCSSMASWSPRGAVGPQESPEDASAEHNMVERSSHGASPQVLCWMLPRHHLS